jgi:hypothetical protein
MSYSLSSNLVPVEWLLAELWPLNLYFCSNFKLSKLFLDVLWYIDLIFGHISKDFKEKSGQLQIWTKNTSSRAITQPKIIRPEQNSNLNCNSSRYSHIPNIRSNILSYSLSSDFVPVEWYLAELWPLNLYFLFTF